MRVCHLSLDTQIVSFVLSCTLKRKYDLCFTDKDVEVLRGTAPAWGVLVLTGGGWTLNTKACVHPLYWALVVPVVQLLSCVQLLVTPWTAALQVSLSLTICQSFPSFMFIASVRLFSHLIL